MNVEKESRKRLISMVLLLLLLTVSFLGGLYMGEQHGVVSTIVVSDEMAALDNALVVKMLKRGEVSAAMERLDLTMDAQILELNGYLTSPYLVTSLDREQRNRAQRVFRIIANERRSSPNHASGVMLEIRKKVKEILDVAVEKGVVLQPK